MSDQKLDKWVPARWPNFAEKEIVCHHCGESWIDPVAMDLLQALRIRFQAPLVINSGHRCAFENAKVGGVPLSEHKKLAFDISVLEHDRFKLFQTAREVGFHGFGFGQYFIHLDTRIRAAHWFYGPVSQKLWQGVLS